MPKGNLNFSDKETEKLFRDIHSQKIHLFNLPKNLYNATGEELTEGVFDGFGASPDINIQAPANDTIRQLKKSVYQFSAAKQFQFISDMQNFLFDEKGMIRPFKEFKVFADVINDQYNSNWLQAEYITSINMATGAADWERIEEEKEVFPFLKYETVGDPRVRNEHAAINGVVKRVDDPFWDTFMPPNGWRCRCDVVQRETGTETNLSKKKVPKLDPVFDGNSGKRKTVFNEKHPYNKVPKKFKKHQENNFGLPLPKDVKEPFSFIEAKTASEVALRLNKAGIKKVDIKKLNMTQSNAVLESIERQADFKPLDIEFITAYSKADSNHLAIYSPSNNAIGLNMSHIKKMDVSDIVPYKEQIKSQKKSISAWSQYIEDLKTAPKNPTNIKGGRKAKSRILALKRNIDDMEKKINKGVLSPKKWSVGVGQKNKTDYLKTTVTHEIGHYRDYKQFRDEGGNFGFQKEFAVSEYGATNQQEFFAESYAEFFHGDKKIISPQLLKIFESWK